MERINEFELYSLAGHLTKLAAHEGGKRKDIWWDAFQAHGALEELLKGKPLTIEVSRASALELAGAIDTGLLKDEKQEVWNPWSEKNAAEDVGSWVMTRIRNSLTQFETIFAAEMREAATYFVPRRGIYHTPSLVDHADQSFPSYVGPEIPTKSKVDWKAAGRCLAFNLHTASGFHVARAVEGTLEVYYQLFCKQAEGATLKGWNDYVLALAGVTDALKPSDKTLAELTQMKDDFRNPIMHPRVILTESDARMLFDNGESLIIAMAGEIVEANK